MERVRLFFFFSYPSFSFSHFPLPLSTIVMTSVVTSLERQLGSEYGCRIETPAGQTMIGASCLPSNNPTDTKRQLLNYPYRSNLIVLVRFTICLYF